MRSISTFGIAILLMVGMFVVATSEGAGAANTTQPGITGSSINITFIYNDLSILTQEHLAPSDGNVLANVQDAVNYLNDHGGIGARKINLTSYKMPSLVGSAATDQAACLAATEQDHAFIVYIGNAVDPSVAQCTAAQHKTLTLIAGSGPPVQYFQQAQGRLFMIGSNAAMDGDRQTTGWAEGMAKSGALKGKKIGVVVEGVQTVVDSINNDLKPELAKFGYHVAAEATVPLPAGATQCTQTSTAAEVMKQAGVNMVFVAAYDLCGVAVVTGFKALGYKPEFTTNADNVTDTVAQFFAPVKDWFDGAYGVGTFGPVPINSGAATCVDKEINPEEHYQNVAGALGGAFNVAAQTCVTFQQLAGALKKASPNLSRANVISALESQAVQPMQAGPLGSLGPHQHDAANYLYIARYSAADGKFNLSNPTPFKVPCPCAP